MARKYCVLYNPKAGNGNGEAAAMKLKTLMSGDTLRFVKMTDIGNYTVFFRELPEDEKLLIAGGDGTLNRFVNETDGLRGDREIWYYPTGSGNDFWKDIGQAPDGKPAEISGYFSDLPRVTVKGETRLFLNGIGYGIDGYCCEKGDELRQKTDKPLNYTPIALKGLLYDYHPTNATVTVDGKTSTYSHVWMAPAMKGRYFGGGMMATPKQDRKAPDHTVTSLVVHCRSKLRMLAAFPGVFKGTHVKHTDMVTFVKGKKISVRFDRPTALQIDGETVLNVTEYSVEI